jgi:hypothetical protein
VWEEGEGEVGSGSGGRLRRALGSLH